jgi:hypothetical protein
MAETDQPIDAELRAERTNSELSLYDNLVKWYTEKSEGMHRAALAFGVLLLIVELGGFIANPPYMMKLAGSTGLKNSGGYDNYTPTLWLAGVFTGLILFFVMRYSHVYQMRQRAKLFADNFMLPRWVQYAAIDITILTIASEIVLIAATKWTISSLSRGQAIAHPWLYWVFGLVAAAIVFITTDLKRLPRIVRLSLTLWVAILAHIFWWITP